MSYPPFLKILRLYSSPTAPTFSETYFFELPTPKTRGGETCTPAGKRTW